MTASTTGHGRRRGAGLAALLALVTATAVGCTVAGRVGGSAGTGSTLGAPALTAPALTGPAAGGIETTDPARTESSGSVTVPPITDAGSTGGTTPAAPARSTTTTTAPVIPQAAVVVTPSDKSTAISPLAPVTVRVQAGTLRAVTLSNAEGRNLPGMLAADRSSWTITPELGYGKTYTVRAATIDKAGRTATHTSTFTTLTPPNRTKASIFPINGRKVGVGQPVSVVFDEPITDRAAAEKMITVTSSPKQVGAFHWFSDREVHWRPKVYWKSGTKVTVSVKIYGAQVGDGLYGQQDEKSTFRVGRSMIATIDDNTKQLVVRRDGKVIKTMPVSMGSNRYPTYNGVHVVAEKYTEKIMDSRTWGLTGAGAYRTRVEWATRISSTGEFVHAAPWSVDQQGYTNVSHGCVNVSTENAKWFHDNFTFGDIVHIKNTAGTDLQSWDGYGDWQLSFSEYRQGSAA